MLQLLCWGKTGRSKGWSSQQRSLSYTYFSAFQSLNSLQERSLPNQISQILEKVLENERIVSPKPESNMKWKQLSDSDSTENLNVCMGVEWKEKLGNIRSKNEDSFIHHSDQPRSLREVAGAWVPSNTSLSIVLSMESPWARVCLVVERGLHKATW